MNSSAQKRRSSGKTNVAAVIVIAAVCLITAFLSVGLLKNRRPSAPQPNPQPTSEESNASVAPPAPPLTAALTPEQKKAIDDEVEGKIDGESLSAGSEPADADSSKTASQLLHDQELSARQQYEAAEQNAQRTKQAIDGQKTQPTTAQLEQLEKYEAEERARQAQLRELQAIDQRQKLSSSLENNNGGSNSVDDTPPLPASRNWVGQQPPPPPPPPPPSDASAGQQASADEQEKLRERVAELQAIQRSIEQTEQSAKSPEQQEAEAEAALRGAFTPPPNPTNDSNQTRGGSQTRGGGQRGGSSTSASTSPPSNSSNGSAASAGSNSSGASASGSAASGDSSADQRSAAILAVLRGEDPPGMANIFGGDGASEPPPDLFNTDYYNATLSPVAPSTNNELLDQQPTTVDFYIGQGIGPMSAVPRANAAVSRQIETQGKNQSLTITLTCSFCSGARLQKSVITYSPAARSTDAKFKIVPDKKLSDRDEENLVFGVTGPDGIVYDNVVVPVSIAAANSGTQESSTKPTSPATAAATHQEANFSAPPGARAVDLTITVASKNNQIVIQLEPANADIAKLFAGKEFHSTNGAKCLQTGPACAIREFSTGLSADALSQELRADYLSLASMVSGDTGLYQRLEGSTGTLPTLSGATSLSADEQNSLLNEIHGDGAELYQHLFHDSQTDPDLGTLLKALDGYDRPDKKPLIVRIEEQSVYLPWQFLHPAGPMDAQKFWGFRYELVVDPEGRLTPGYLPGALKYDKTSSTVFGKYHSDTTDNANSDQISVQGDAYAKFLSGLGFANLTTVDSKSTFLKNLQSDQESLEMLAVFTHATNDLPQGPSGSAQPGPEIFFAQNDFVTIRDLQRLTVGQETTELFHVRPLVFLNGCETGTAGNVATGALNFPSTFLDMGARGVIATEAPVWPAFAYDFGSSMMNALKGSNQPVSQVLLQTRKDFLQKNHNPLGLLYTYYGGVDAALILP